MILYFFGKRLYISGTHKLLQSVLQSVLVLALKMLHYILTYGGVSLTLYCAICLYSSFSLMAELFSFFFPLLHNLFILLSQ